MAALIQTLKNILLKAGYTVLRGDLRESIKQNQVTAALPAQLLANARVCANRYEVLKYIPTGGTAVEVGVGYGDFTEPLLQTLQPKTFIAIDTFGITADNEPWGRTHLKENGCSHYDYYKQQFKAWIETGNMVIKKGLSWEMLQQLPDRSIDYIYIDADHTYESVSKEISAFKSKLKEQAIVQFNDYTLFDQNALMPFGVPKAVHEFMIAEDFEMLYLCLHPQGFCDVVLKKRV